MDAGGLIQAGRAKRIWLPLALCVAFLLGGATVFLLRPQMAAPAPDPEQIAASTLLSLREQGRASFLVGRYVAMSTSSESRLGLTARKTLIMPGQVRYGLDLARLRRSDLAWDPSTLTLNVTLPPLELTGPDVDLGQVQEYSEGGLLMALTDAERALDQANIRGAQDELMRQARARTPMHLARQSALRSVANAFALPLRSAGIDASVAVRFVDGAGQEEQTFLDRPRRIDEAIDARRKDSR